MPPALSMLLWSVLAVVGGYWVFSLKARDGGPAPAAVRAPGLIAVVRHPAADRRGIRWHRSAAAAGLGSAVASARQALRGSEAKVAESGLAFEDDQV